MIFYTHRSRDWQLAVHEADFGGDGEVAAVHMKLTQLGGMDYSAW